MAEDRANSYIQKLTKLFESKGYQFDNETNKYQALGYLRGLQSVLPASHASDEAPDPPTRVIRYLLDKQLQLMQFFETNVVEHVVGCRQPLHTLVMLFQAGLARHDLRSIFLQRLMSAWAAVQIFSSYRKWSRGQPPKLDTIREFARQICSRNSKSQPIVRAAVTCAKKIHFLEDHMSGLGIICVITGLHFTAVSLEIGVGKVLELASQHEDIKKLAQAVRGFDASLKIISLQSSLCFSHTTHGGFREWLTNIPYPVACNVTPKDLLFCFTHVIARTRTLQKRNLYAEIFTVGTQCALVFHGMIMLAAVYLQLPNATKPQQQLWSAVKKRHAELENLPTVSSHDRWAVLGTASLSLQAVLVQQNLNGWKEQVNFLPQLIRDSIQDPSTEPYRMRLAAHAILANTVLPPRLRLSSSVFLSDAELDHAEIDGQIGLSPQLLNTLRLLEDLPGPSPCFTPRKLLDLLLSLRQHYNGATASKEIKECICNTAETYRLGALLLLEAKCPGTMTALEHQFIQASLVDNILKLPVSGPLYTAMHPLWSVFVASILCPQQRSDLKRYLAAYTIVPQSNMAQAVNLIPNIWTRNPRNWEDVIATFTKPISLT